jgi:hexosaminidase
MIISVTSSGRCAAPSWCHRLLFTGGLLAASAAPAAPVTLDLMPMPADLQAGPGRLPLTPAFCVAYQGKPDARIGAALARTMLRLEERSGLVLPRTPAGGYAPAADAGSATLVIDCVVAGEAIPRLGEDESYALEITPVRAWLRAPTSRGILHGLATLQQLIQSDAAGWYLPVVTIADQPRFPWRGLLIDVCRHWQPMEVIKRNLDGMALVKLNVLHLHLTDDQGFRIQSTKFPRLQELGSDGHYYTQAEMREIIAYAAARGIRVVPEFDIPGHATSWLVGHPELGSAAGPYVLERKWGVFNPVLDPTNEEVYRVLDGFLGEMAALFPDEFLHIGGDENNGVDWSANLHIQQFIREHRLRDNTGLHAYFNQRVHALLQTHGKKLIGWDEILNPELPAGSVIQSWRGPEGIAQATARGLAAVLSNGYYIDLNYPAAQHYLNDPAPAAAPLTAGQRALVLGGEATMWSEWVTPEIIDSRIWPRTAAIAERLWSREEVRDVPDMYRRLTAVSHRLEETGLRHESYIDPALRRLAGEQATAADLQALRRFVDLLEPVKEYQRGGQQPAASQFTPLTGLADCARPDSAATREFAAAVEEFLAQPRSAAAVARVTSILADWRDLADHLLARLPALSPRLAEAQPLLRALAEAATAGSAACESWQLGRALSVAKAGEATAAVQRAAIPAAAVELPAAKPLARLVAARPGAAIPTP